MLIEKKNSEVDVAKKSWNEKIQHTNIEDNTPKFV